MAIFQASEIKSYNTNAYTLVPKLPLFLPLCPKHIAWTPQLYLTDPPWFWPDLQLQGWGDGERGSGGHSLLDRPNHGKCAKATTSAASCILQIALIKLESEDGATADLRPQSAAPGDVDRYM